MYKIVNSIKKRPINLFLMLFSICVYFLNNCIIKKCTVGCINVFFSSYFNDLLCPLFFLGYCNMLLITCDIEITKLIPLIIIIIFSGFIWEFFAPIIKIGAVTDLKDIICYIFGTIIYWGIIKITKMLIK